METDRDLEDIECANCMMQIGITQDFVNLAWCGEDCYAEWLENQNKE